MTDEPKLSIQMAQRIELWPLDRLKPYERNARTHSAEQVAQIAASIVEFGFTNPILVDSGDGIIAGHGRLQAARELGLSTVPVVVLDHLSDRQRRAYVLADNQLALNAGWDLELLRTELQDLVADDFDLSVIGFSDEELEDLLPEVEELPPEELSDADAVPELPADPVSKPGDVWLLGKHRVMCGDSTAITDVERLMDGKKAQLMHADPPYGMGKASDGVANDNLYNDDLDNFQMEWWATFRSFLVDNASAYIWGNAPELWRLWYKAGLGSSEKMELRNQIVWDKKAIPGMASPDLTQFPIATEHCLFFQIGNQFRGNVNADDFPETWEPLRSYLEGEAKAAQIGSAEIKSLCGVQMYGHWFTRSQFNLIPEKHYATLQKACVGRFIRPWRQLKAEWDKVKGGPTSEIQGARSYFDNAHDVMRDVWEFGRVTGEERHGHATPKPVAMMERVMKSSLPSGGLCVEPFGGSGSTLIGAEAAGRVCYAMELNPVYVDVIVKRWQAFTGKRATLEATGEVFAEDAA
jgi:DNA modification methylase